jgi:hypothetical protein
MRIKLTCGSSGWSDVDLFGRTNALHWVIW